jgi:hypothetical protein
VVVLGESNENNVVVEQGLQSGVQVYLSSPAKPESFKLVGEELITVIKEREKAKKAEEMRLRAEAEKAKEESGGRMGQSGMNITPEMMQRFQNMRGGQQGVQNAGPQDTAAMRRFARMRNSQQGSVRDTTARRMRQPGQPGNGPAPAQTPVRK